jgi:hypothetical protein
MADQMECVGLVNEVEDALVDDCIESIDDATVDLAPFSVALDEWRRGTDVADKSEARGCECSRFEPRPGMQAAEHQGKARSQRRRKNAPATAPWRQKREFRIE